MPLWLAILVALLSGVGSGLLGTLVKLRHDRETETRGRVSAASQDFAAAGAEWLDRAHAAIKARADQSADDGPNYDAAVTSLKDARKLLARLLVVVGPDSPAGRAAVSLVS